MGLTVSKCEIFVAQAPADKVKKHPAGDGLYFVVGRGRAYWSYQFRRGTSWSAKGLGGYPEFSPKDARDRLKHWQVTGSLHGEPPRAAQTFLKINPSTPRKATAEVGVPFTEALSQWLEIASQGWRNPRTAAQARSALTKLPLSAEPVDLVNTDMVLRDLLRLPARQRQDVRMWLAALLDFTKGQKWRTWDPDEGNPAKFENERRGMWPKFKKSGNHHAALPWADLPALMAKLPADKSDASRALMWTILTAVRTGDTEGAKWKQIHGDIWTIPVAKNGKPLRVPLTKAALALLGKRPKKPDAPLFDLRPNAMRICLQAIEPDVTVHGMRSTFRDWCSEHEHRRDLAEMALGHAIGSAVEGAYARSDLLKLRHELMDAWSTYATGH
jgi:integrase